MTYSELRIDRLKIDAFRGFRDPQEFDLSASAVIVTGPNGTGKTSFFDAIQWALLGRLERLESLRSRRNVEHVVNQYSSGRKATVEVELGFVGGSVVLRRTGDHSGSTLEVKRSGHASVFGDEAEAELRRTLLPSSELSLESTMETSGLMQQDVLRRVLEAKPADRYRQLSTVLGLSVLEDFEDATKLAAKQTAEREAQARTEHAKTSVALKQAQDRLEAAQARLASRPQIQAAREEALAALGDVPSGFSLDKSRLALSGLDDVRLTTSAFAAVGQQFDSIELLTSRAAQLRAELGEEPAPDEIPRLRAAVEEAEVRKSTAEGLRGGAQSQLNAARLMAAEVAKLAAMAVPLLSDSCPVCRQSIDRAHVEQDLLERAEATGTLLELDRNFVELHNSFSEAAAAATAARQALSEAELLADRWRALREAEAAATTAVEALRDGNSIVVTEQRDVGALAEILPPAKDYVRRSRRILQDLLETFDRQSDQASVERAAAEVKSLGAALDNAEALLRETSARSKKLHLLAERTLKARVEVTEQRLRSIQPLVANIFQRLDPHPAFKTVEFELDTYYRKGTSSPLVVDEIASISADPLLVFSTSQANIVALSYFIAMSLSMGKAGLPFLLLDDPVQSMDDINVLGFADLCRHLRTRRQLIVSTHERRLSGLLERKLAPRSENDRTKIIRFTGWDRSGPTIEQRFVAEEISNEPIRLLRHAS